MCILQRRRQRHACLACETACLRLPLFAASLWHATSAAAFCAAAVLTAGVGNRLVLVLLSCAARTEHLPSEKQAAAQDMHQHTACSAVVVLMLEDRLMLLNLAQSQGLDCCCACSQDCCCACFQDGRPSDRPLERHVQGQAWWQRLPPPWQGWQGQGPRHQAWPASSLRVRVSEAACREPALRADQCRDAQASRMQAHTHRDRRAAGGLSAE